MQANYIGALCKPIPANETHRNASIGFVLTIAGKLDGSRDISSTTNRVMPPIRQDGDWLGMVLLVTFQCYASEHTCILVTVADSHLSNKGLES